MGRVLTLFQHAFALRQSCLHDKLVRLRLAHGRLPVERVSFEEFAQLPDEGIDPGFCTGIRNVTVENSRMRIAFIFTVDRSAITQVAHHE